MTDPAGFGSASPWAKRRVLVLSPTPSHPHNLGNRRRIYFACRRIRELGGRIHFLHYPSEEEWSESLPLSDQRRMIEEWDAYYAAPVTRPLYAPPAAQDHTIDEWWDPGIGDMLQWLFRVQTFDVFIVNYAWLSKAFEYAPPGIVKVLDTHDRFSGRRALFEAHGLAPQYFHIRESEERVALQRADVVWAIKPQEETLFRRNTDRRVLTLLHAEPLATSWPRRGGGVLRFGIAGSGNEINIVNFRRFIEVAAEYVRATLLPCEFVVAGSCCEGLGESAYPFVRHMGALERMDDFYDAVDVVLGPMEFSTGLKIRIGEAMSRGKAVVSHRHCFEGYQPMHPFHALASFEEMMRACRDIVRAPQLIEELELASIESMTRALRSVDGALEATLPPRRKIPTGFVFVAEPRAISPGSAVIDHLCEAAAYVAHQCRPIFFLDGEGTSDRRSLARLGKFGTVVCSRRAAAALAEAAAPFVGLHPDPISFEELLSSDQLGFWFTRVPEHIPPLREPNRAPAFVPLSVLAARIDEPQLVEFLAALKRSFTEVVAMDAAGSRLLAAAAGLGATTHLVPSLWCTDLSDVLKDMAEAKRETVTLFASRPDGVLPDLVREVARRSTRRPMEYVYDDRATGPLEPPAAGPGQGTPPIPVSDYARRLGRGKSIPFAVVELGQSSAFGLLRELLDRAGVPRLSLFDPAPPRAIVAGRVPDRVAGVMESAVVLADWLREEERFADLGARGRARYGALDPGWTIIWDLVSAASQRRAELSGVVAGAPGVEGDAGCREVGAEIVLHIEREGDCSYREAGWAGKPGERRYIEAFGIRPLEAFAAADIEYKAFGPNGRQTPWVSNGALCGTRDHNLPLTGFAIRLAPHLRDRFEVVYEGAYVEGGVIGPSRNGEPCLPAILDDRLEAMLIRLLERPIG